MVWLPTRCIALLFCCFSSVERLRFPIEIRKQNWLLMLLEADQIPETFFGIFFEEINHAGAGGLWAELVSNRGHSLFFYLYI
ncbi:hypothetical protein Patl1_22266 [Pistacia atlantica]|uniref:Uncharacterized protein n=1 Tax=Pistacia atlantica TaxID=434234 RepID=A0ACC1BJ11_9ROSI|nr:hypothetical protein Patl1_22266 [Pistacia atlantica]